MIHQRFVVLSVAGLAAMLVSFIGANSYAAQEDGLKDRPVKAVRVDGLENVPERLVTNQIRIKPGDPYDQRVVSQDVVRITHLNRFGKVQVRVEPQDDGSVIVVYDVEELPLISDVQVIGNKKVNDQELLAAVLVRTGDPASEFLITRGIERIKQIYTKKGYFLIDVTIDRELLNESGLLIFQVREGPKVTIKDLKIEGNTSFPDKQLQSRIKSSKKFLIFKKGTLSQEQIDADAAAIRQFYRDRGFLDAECASEIRVSPNYKDAIVVFTVKEGPQYIVDSIEVKFTNPDQDHVFSKDQILRDMVLKVGDVFSEQAVSDSRNAIYDRYGKLGYIETRLVRANGSDGIDRIFHENEPKVDVVVTIEEGERLIVGAVTLTGNDTTKQKVILRQLRGLDAGTYFDRTAFERTRKRLEESALFSEARITILEPDEDQIDSQIRDVLVEVREQNTGSLSFGAGVSSDSGLIGAIDLVQRNFDIADPPESFGEMFTGKAFRGAGQYFAISLQPGDEVSRYSVTLREPYFLETAYFVEGSAFFFTRERDEYDEQRYGGNASVGQRFGDIYSASIRFRAEEIEISDIERFGPIDVFEVEGDSLLTAIEFTIRRSTTDSRIFPTRGSDARVTLGRAGALGGDYDFTRLEGIYAKYWTVDEDFFGRKTVFSIKVRSGYIFEEDEAPVFERFYAGGARTFRGFDFRGIGPRGLERRPGGRIVQGDDPVGGDFLFLLGAEYNFPIYEEFLRGVFFVDSGTLNEDISLSDYRVSIGGGVRLSVPIFGQVPIALDFAYPVIKEDEDDRRLFSFSVAVPIR